ncbi:MAG: hypothetical protein V4710_19800, partial [Verrucomicrobiota bacterium]
MENPFASSLQSGSSIATDSYGQFLGRLRNRFSTLVADTQARLFTTDAEGLFDTYLQNIAPELRREHTCHCCRRFIELFGGLVVINPDGSHTSAFWDLETALPVNAAAIKAIALKVAAAQVTGVFLSDQKRWGTPVTGAWHHLAVIPPAHLVYRGLTLSASQAMAAKLEDFGILNRALAEFNPNIVDQAAAILSSEALYRS